MVSSPYQATCNTCSKPLAAGTLGGWSGTITLGGSSYSGFTSGTVFFGPKPTPPTFKEKRADEVIADWKKDGGWTRLRTLIIDAMNDVIEDEYPDEDDDE